jgi:NADPH:quinone reductase-like Zn-dependent oxidoreductase
MGDLVGKPTGRFTKAGKPTFITPDGEEVSEKSISIPYKDKFVNIPSIHKGVRKSEDEVIDMLEKGRVKPTSTHDTMDEAVKAAKERSANLMKKGGKVKSASQRADGCAIRGKTRAK